MLKTMWKTPFFTVENLLKDCGKVLNVKLNITILSQIFTQ